MVYFQTKKNLFVYIFEGLGIDDVGIFCGHLEYFTTILCICFMALWYSLLSFGNFLPRFGMLYQVKSGNPAGLTQRPLHTVMPMHCYT
jgi:hypothetical protein